MRSVAGRQRAQRLGHEAASALLAIAALVAPVVAEPAPASSGTREPLSEIVVTARKVEEESFGVPISLQVVSGDLVDAMTKSSLYQLQFDIPGLVVANLGMNGAGVALRGVTDSGAGNLAVAAHIAGVYLGRSNLALARMFDIERVEVLKGPQGTLYGRNATGGSINIVTRSPGPSFSAAVEGAVGSFDSARLQAHINVPADRFAARLAVTVADGDGFIRNSVDSRRFAEEDYVGARLSFRIQPGDATTIDIVAQRVEDDGAAGELWVPRKDYLLDPSDIRLTTVTLENPYLETVNDIVSADVSFDIGATTLTSISGYAKGITRDLDDCAGTPQLVGCVRGYDPLSYEQLSQEIRLASSGNSIDWLAGLYFLDADAFADARQSFPALGPSSANDYWSTEDETAHAAFGQVTGRVNERWSVTGGLRVSHETAHTTYQGTSPANSSVSAAEEDSWDDSAWLAGFEYLPTASAVFFANVSTGFTSGGFTRTALPTGELDPYGPENLTAYEGGVRLRLPGRRWILGATAFRYDFDDMQVPSTIILANRPVTVVDNAAAARIYGTDMSSEVRIAERFTFSGALVWMPEREFVEFTGALAAGTLSGNTVSRAPEWSASTSLDYSHRLRRGGDFSVRIAYDYRSEFFFTPENDPVAAQEAFGLWSMSARLDSAVHGWYAFASARNLLDTDYFNHVFLQSSPGYPSNYEIGFGTTFE